MSTYWRLRCADCGDECDEPSINHGENILRDIATIGRWMTMLDGEQEIDYEITLWGRYVPMWFFRRHHGHRLDLRSEYGRTEALEIITEPQTEADQLARWLG